MITPRKNTGIRMPITLDKKLTDLADKKGLTKNALMIQILSSYFDKKRNEVI